MNLFFALILIKKNVYISDDFNLKNLFCQKGYFEQYFYFIFLKSSEMNFDLVESNIEAKFNNLVIL